VSSPRAATHSSQERTGHGQATLTAFRRRAVESSTTVVLVSLLIHVKADVRKPSIPVSTLSRRSLTAHKSPGTDHDLAVRCRQPRHPGPRTSAGRMMPDAYFTAPRARSRRPGDRDWRRGSAKSTACCRARSSRSRAGRLPAAAHPPRHPAWRLKDTSADTNPRGHRHCRAGCAASRNTPPTRSKRR